MIKGQGSYVKFNTHNIRYDVPYVFPHWHLRSSDFLFPHRQAEISIVEDRFESPWILGDGIPACLLAWCEMEGL